MLSCCAFANASNMKAKLATKLIGNDALTGDWGRCKQDYEICWLGFANISAALRLAHNVSMPWFGLGRAGNSCWDTSTDYTLLMIWLLEQSNAISKLVSYNYIYSILYIMVLYMSSILFIYSSYVLVKNLLVWSLGEGQLGIWACENKSPPVRLASASVDFSLGHKPKRVEERDRGVENTKHRKHQ